MAEQSSGNLSTPESKASEIKVETLWRLSFELIAKSMLLWRTYRDDEKSKGRKIAVAKQIFQMVMEAIRLHPDIQHLEELVTRQEELERYAPQRPQIIRPSKSIQELLAELKKEEMEKSVS